MLLLYRTVVNVTRLGWSGPYPTRCGFALCFPTRFECGMHPRSHWNRSAGCRCFSFDWKNGGAFRHLGPRFVPLSWGVVFPGNLDLNPLTGVTKATGQSARTGTSRVRGSFLV